MNYMEMDELVAEYGFDKKECEACQRNSRMVSEAIQKEEHRLKSIFRRGERCVSTATTAMQRTHLNDIDADLHRQEGLFPIHS